MPTAEVGAPPPFPQDLFAGHVTVSVQHILPSPSVYLSEGTPGGGGCECRGHRSTDTRVQTALSAGRASEPSVSCGLWQQGQRCPPCPPNDRIARFDRFEPVGPAVRRQAGRRRDLGSYTLRLSFLFKNCDVWTLSCDFVSHN